MFFFCSYRLIFCPLDPDPGSQNLADSTDPDPKHLLKEEDALFTTVQSFVLKILFIVSETRNAQLMTEKSFMGTVVNWYKSFNK